MKSVAVGVTLVHAKSISCEEVSADRTSQKSLRSKIEEGTSISRTLLLTTWLLTRTYAKVVSLGLAPLQFLMSMPM